MIKWFCESWQVLLGVSAVIGIISGLIDIWRWLYKDKEYSVAVQILLNLIFTVSCAFVIVSCIIGISMVKVPELRGSTFIEAKQKLSDNGLDMDMEPGLSNDIDTQDYKAIGQSYDADEMVLKGTKIMVYFEKLESDLSQNWVDVPDLVGNIYTDAVSVLKENGLQYRIKTFDGSNESVENAYVINQSIIAGSSVPEGSLVDLELSVEKNNISLVQVPVEMTTVPNVVGMEQQEAVGLLEKEGFNVRVSWLTGTDESLDHYYIVNQSIASGSTVPIGSIVELERSAVKPGTSVTVPNVVGMEQQEATTLLTNLGLQFQVWWTEENNVSTNHYYIIEQSIPKGSSVPSGTLVKLELSVSKPK